MCDTLFAPGSATADGVAVFGKNSDREPNEAHHLVRIPGAVHPPGSTVTCTYVEIPQVAQTFEVLLAKPFWIWGAEMGANEHGVVLGNEAVFTRVPHEKVPGLIGMDLVRLALERAATARAALDVITGLLAQHGQGGNCGFTHTFHYHNSFLIADSTDAWVLETAGRQWAAEQVKGIRTVSNGLTIGSRWDLASEDLVAYARDRGWHRGRGEFDFARCYSRFLYPTLGRSRARQRRTTELLESRRGKITVLTMMAALRDHGPAAGPAWSPARGVACRQICQHAGFGPIRGDQATGSMVSHLGPDLQTHFLTGTAAPCTSLFKPVWLGAALPDTGPAPAGTYDAASLFWRHEALHRATLGDYTTRLALYHGERDALERQFAEGAWECRGATPADRAAYSQACFVEADAAEARWAARVLAAGCRPRWSLSARRWAALNHAAQMPQGM